MTGQWGGRDFNASGTDARTDVFNSGQPKKKVMCASRSGMGGRFMRREGSSFFFLSFPFWLKPFFLERCIAHACAKVDFTSFFAL